MATPVRLAMQTHDVRQLEPCNSLHHPGSRPGLDATLHAHPVSPLGKLDIPEDNAGLDACHAFR